MRQAVPPTDTFLEKPTSQYCGQSRYADKLKGQQFHRRAKSTEGWPRIAVKRPGHTVWEHSYMASVSANAETHQHAVPQPVTHYSAPKCSTVSPWLCFALRRYYYYFLIFLVIESNSLYYICENTASPWLKYQSECSTISQLKFAAKIEQHELKSRTLVWMKSPLQ